MANYVHDEAICLRVHDFSETSQIVSLFTRHYGILPLIAKGAKRPNKNGPGAFSGPLDLLTAGEIVFLPAKATAELGTLAAWQLTDHRTALRQDLRALNAAMVCADLTLALIHSHDPHEELQSQLTAALELLPTPERTRVLVAYAKAALTAAGYQPHLDVCANCGNPVETHKHYRFSPSAGGVCCAVCRVPESAGACGRATRLASVQDNRAEARRSLKGPLPDEREREERTEKEGEVPGIIVLALDRLPTPRALQAALPDRPADPAALRTAMELLLTQVEAITDRPLKTRWLLNDLFATPQQW